MIDFAFSRTYLRKKELVIEWAFYVEKFDKLVSLKWKRHFQILEFGELLKQGSS